MKIWECDMCKKTLREDYDVFEISCGHPKKCDDGIACEVGVHKMVAYTTYELCSDCAKSVERFIKDGLQEVVIPINPSAEDLMMLGAALKKIKPSVLHENTTVEPRKTCNTCVHFLTAKSRCLKKKVPIHENDRDACMGWSDKKTCTNCKYNGKDHCSALKAAYLGDNGHCDGWES